jgi:hypothetical protein
MNLVYGEKYGDVNDPKTNWITCGSVFVDDETGRISIKLESMPISKNFTGWFGAFERNVVPADGQASSAGGDKGTSKNGDEPINLDEIPF